MILNAIRRVNEYISPELLPDNEVTELKNMVLDGGSAKRRGGVQSYSLLTTGGTIKGLYELDGYTYGLVDVGSTRTLKKLDSTWSSIKSSLSDLPLQMQRHNDVGYFSNGTDDIFTVQNSVAQSFMITKPDVSGTTLAISSGGSLDATAWYCYKLVYVTDSGVHSSFSSTLTIQTDGTNKTITLTDLPTSSDTRVTGRKLYRNQGDSDTFYLLSTLDNSTTTYTDSSADTSLDSEGLNYLTEIDTAKSMCFHKDRLILGGVTATEYPNIYPFSLIAENDGTGSNLTGTYSYGISLNMANGTETDIITTAEVTITASAGSVTYAPMGGVSRPDVISVNIYRSKNSGLYFLVGTYTDQSDNINDNTATLTSAYPAVGTQYESVTSPSRVYFSDIDKPQQIPQLNYIDVYPDDDEEIVGVVDQQEGILVFKEKSIHFIYTSGSPYNWRVVRLAENIGCSDSLSIQRAKNAVYFKYFSDIYRFPDWKIISQEFSTTLKDITIVDTAYVSKRGWYVLVSSSILYIYDEIHDTWLYFEPSGTQFNSANETISGDFLIGSTVLLKYDPDTSLDFNTASRENEDAIACSLKSKHYLAPQIGQEFRIRKLFTRFNQGSGSVTQKIIDPINSTYRSKTYTGSGWKENKEITDSFTGSLKSAHTLRFEVSGDVAEYTYMRTDHRLRNRNRIWS